MSAMSVRFRGNRNLNISISHFHFILKIRTMPVEAIIALFPLILLSIIAVDIGNLPFLYATAEDVSRSRNLPTFNETSIPRQTDLKAFRIQGDLRNDQSYF